MPPRRQEMRTGADVFSDVYRRLKKLEETCSRRVLPPGYEFTTDGSGNIVIIRASDGEQVTITI